jgi:hypothetical protein
MKKFYFLFLLTLLPLVASAASQVEIDGIWYSLNSGIDTKTASVAPNPNGYYSGFIAIPESVTYGEISYSVTSIGRQAFYKCSGLTFVTIPNSVTYIDSKAFGDCSSLTSITIPNSVTFIGGSTFKGCSRLTSVTIPNSVTTIGYQTFYDCSSLTSITIPNSVTSIGFQAFENCSGLISITIPNSVASIDHQAFFGCSNLTSVNIPNSVTSIGQEAFSECSSLTSITIPNGVTTIGRGAFEGTAWYDNQPDGLVYAGSCAYKYKGEMPENTTISLKEGTISIADHAFRDCSGLTSIIIPNSVSSIGNNAFWYCSSLTSVIIPNSVTSIGHQVFDGCSILTSIKVDSDNMIYDSRDNCNAIIETSSNTLIVGSATTIIPNSVTSIGYEAFEGRSGLTSITFPNSVTEIQYGAFLHCTGLTSIELPSSIKTIDDVAFSNCSITSVIIPSSVTKIGRGSPFSNCNDLTSIIVESGNTVYDSRNNCNAIIETATNELIAGCKTTIIPNSVTSIGYNSMSSFKDLTSITIPNSVKSIAFGAFQCCGLTSITIPNSVTSIGDYAFGNCTGLTSVTTLAMTPPQVGEQPFTKIDIPLYVPKGTRDTYLAASPWNKFKEIKEIVDPNEFSLSFMGQTIKDGASLLINAEGWSALGNIYTDPDGNTKNGLFIFVNKGGKVSGSYSLEILSNTLNGDLKWSMGGETYALNEVSKIEKSFSTDENGIASVKFSAENIPNEGSLDAKLIVTIGEKTKTFYIKINFKKKDSPDLTVSGKVGEPVDLGLSVKWASWNVGAGAPEEYGNHYAWGELEPKTDYSASTYKFYNSCYTKYGSIDNKYELDETDDVARQKWGEDWRMPTINELKELYEKCSFTRETINGVPVTKVTGPNGNYIYMPGPGNFTGQTLYFKDNVGSYWSRDLETDSYAKDLDFFTGYRSLNGDTRYHGQSVRPVYVEEIKYKIGDPVDLGLSSGTLWSSCNIGASSPEEFGAYFAWGETAPKSNYDWTTYKFGGGSNFTKYNSSDGLTELELQDDAAYMLWGENWRMPTHKQELELVNECSWESTTLNGVSGYKITGPNGKSIFMPRGGLYDGTDYDCDGTTVSSANTDGWYWSSTLNAVGSSYAQGLCFFPSLLSNVSDHERCDGHNIRPVYVGGLSKRIVHVTEAGTLPTFISDAEKYSIEELTITGELNGSDIRLLRDMAGNNYKGEVTEGKLRVLDLSGTSIVEGGDPYLESSSIKTTVGATMFPIYGSKYSTSKDVISYYMFAGCNNLQSVKLPAGITSIHFNGFAYCINMESITIFDKVTYIETAAFDNCRKLASIKIPKSVTTLYGSSLDGGSLTSIVVEEGNPKYDSRDNCNAVIETENNKLIIGCKGSTIPNTVTAIGMQAFMGCQFTSISIPSSVKTIEYGAFDASALTSITIPSTVESIGIQIFRQCNQLTSIVVESGNPNYDSRENCNAIIETATNKLIATCSTTVVPSSVTALGEYTFTQWKEIPSNLLDNVKIICDNAFDNALFVSIIIPEGVEIIGKEAFRCCNVMKTISLPASLKTIGDDVFSICYNLTEVYSHNPNPSDISENVFNYQIWDSSTHEYVPFSDKATLYVPAGSKEKYKQADGWKEFKYIVEMGETAPITIGKSGKASYCGDKSLDFSFSDEVKAYIASGFDKDEGTIWLTRVKDVPAGVPVLIKGESNKTYNVPVTDSQNSYYTNMFVGNTSGASIEIYETSDDGSKVNYYLKDGTFLSVSGNATIGNNKCYLQLPATFNAAVTGESQTVTIKESGKASFAAPVDLDFTNVEGLKAFTATGYDKSTKTIWLTRVMKVQQGEGVLLKGDPDNYEIPSVAAQSHYENMFVGNTSGTTIEIPEMSDDGSLTNYYLKSGTFLSVSGNAKIGNNKCYLALPTSMVAVASTRSAEENYKFEEPEMIKLPISFRSIGNDGDGTTGINVQSSMQSDNAYYTLQGQRVVNPGKGLYIKNGKKVVIK